MSNQLISAAVKRLTANLASVLSGLGDALIGVILNAAGAVARTQHEKNQDIKHIKDFGAALDGATNDDAAWSAALAWAAANAPCTIDCAGYGASKKTTTVLLPAGVTLNQPNILIAANVVGLRYVGEARVNKLKMRFSGTHTQNGVDIGDTTNDAGRSVLNGADIQGAGNDGVQVRNGNLGTLRDIKSVSNGRDGINFTTETPDNNAWTLEGFLDLRGNARDGLNFAQGSSSSDAYAPKSHQGGLIIAQQNGRYGAYVGSRSNDLTIYAESNTSADIFLDVFGAGNLVRVVQAASVTDNSTGSMIVTHSMNADYVRGFINKTVFSGKSGKGLRIANDDGTAGYLDIVKAGARSFQLLCDGTGADQTLDIKNNQNLNFNVKIWGNFACAPQSSVSPVANGDLVVQATSNTQLTFKYKGSDGTVRSANLTLA